MYVGHLVQGHPEHLDGHVVATLLKVNVTHVDLETVAVGEHSILYDHLVCVQGLLV